MSMDLEQRNLMIELQKGKELAEELRKNNLNSISSSQILVDKLLFSYEKALSLLNWNGFSSVSNQNQIQHKGSKKRKMAEKYREKVKFGCGNGFEGAVDDGFSWRKYGQKDILGSKFPRGYYRCSHRDSQGCLAVKQVQRSDQDPSIMEVTYRGRHTCVVHTETLKNTKKQKNQSAEENSNSKSKSAEEFRRFPSFSFLEEEIQGNSELSPATSGCNYFSTTSSLNGVQTPESGLTDDISFFQLNSECTSSQVDFDFCNFDFGTNFCFDDLEFQA